MADIIILAIILISSFVSLFFTPVWIKKARQIGLVWPDMNKFTSEKVSGSGGIIAVISFVVGIFIFIGYRTFWLESPENFVEIFALLTSVILLAGIGLIDDLLGWKQGGLSIRSRVVLILLAAVPLIVINAGRSIVSLPLVGVVNLGLIYPLILVPLGIFGATALFNIFAGYNGLEAGQGIILLSAVSAVAFLLGESWMGVITLVMVASLLGFLVYNFYPAKVFPGDSLTYAVGGLIAIPPIIGNFEKIVVFFFIPYFIEAALKLRGGLAKYSFGKPNSDGTLGQKYDKFYSLNHIAIFILPKIGLKPTERNAVYALWIFQLVFVALGFLLFKNTI